MRNKHAYAWEVRLSKASPQSLVEPAHPIVRIRRALAVRDAVEEMSIVRAFLPHALHLATTWLEVSKVLLAQPGLFVHLDRVPVERARCAGFGGGCEGAEDALGRLAGAAVGRCVELEGIVWFQEGAEAATSVFCLEWLVNDRVP